MEMVSELCEKQEKQQLEMEWLAMSVCEVRQKRWAWLVAKTDNSALR